MSWHPLDRVPRQPLTCIWEITRRCNLRCIHCENHGGEVSARELPCAQIEATAQGLVELGCRIVHVTGGEPLLHPHWERLCRAFARLGLRVTQGGFCRPWLGCRAGLDGLGITSDGRVKGCLSLPDAYSEGSLRDRRLADLWHDPSAFAYNRRFVPTSLSGPCATCEQAPLCRGGCTSAALTLHGRPGTSTHCFRLAAVRPAD